MLISPPFVLDRNADETDAAYLGRAMPDSAVIIANTGIPEGSFPLSLKAGWHGGLHLQAAVENNNRLPVAAIADGKIVYARKPTAENTNPNPGEPRNYNPYGSDPAWTHDGCVIIKHTIKLGSSQPNQTDEVTFLSIYLHLSELRNSAKDAAIKKQPQPVKRKEVIGLSGKRVGADGQLHFEIVCDDANLKRLVGRLSGDGNDDADGRTDLVFGQIYFRLPAGTKFYSERPAFNTVTPTVDPVYTLQDCRLYVGIDYTHGDTGESHRGEAIVTTYQADGSVLGDPLPESDGEYGLYQTALDISRANATVVPGSPANTTPVGPKARVIYELLRFGRVIGPEALTPANLPHWRKVRYSSGEGWVNLNASGITKSSDADFPAWRGWKLIDDDKDGDARCDSEQIKRIVKTAGERFRKNGQTWEDAAPVGSCKKDADAGTSQDGGVSGDGWQATVERPDAADAGTGVSAGTPDDSDGPLTRAKLEARLKLDVVREALQKTICKLPSEWSQDGIEGRWGWLKTDKEFGLNEKDFNEFVAHLKTLAFDWGAANTGIDATHWHFQPRQFVRLFRSFCVWPDLIRRWQAAEDNHQLPNEDGLDDFAKTALYEYGLRASLAAVRNHQNNPDFASLRALDKTHEAKATIFGMRVHTDINAEGGRGDWDDRVTLIKRDNTGLVELLFRGRYTTEPSGRYLDGGEYMKSPDGVNVGGTSHKDIGRLIAERTYEYAPDYSGKKNSNGALIFGSKRFGGNKFNILKKTVASQVERLVSTTSTLKKGEKISESNARWQTGAAVGYSEERSMYFHKGYERMTGSGGCQTFPHSGNDTFDDFMGTLESLKATDRFQYVLKNM